MRLKKLLLLTLCVLLAGCANIGIQVHLERPENTPTPTRPAKETPLVLQTPVPGTPSATIPAPKVPMTMGGASAILFSSNRNGDYQDLYLQEFGTNAITRLTHGDANTFPGPFSPDGKKLLFTGFGLTNSYVGVSNADGSDPVDLTNLPDVSDGFPAWSPDGTLIAFTSRRDGNNEIYLMDAYGHNLKRLTDNPTDDFAPTWSPDGKQIAFLSDRGNDINNIGVYSIYIMNTAASWVKRLTDDGGNDYTPAWSPDGSTILFRSVQKGQSDIYSISADGSNLTNLTNTADAEEWSPQWSPDGSLIAFQTDRDRNWEIYLMDANGSNPVNFTNNPADDQMPYWKKATETSVSPSRLGTLAFVSFKDDDLAVYSINADGEALTRLTHDSMLIMNPVWSPDGSRIAFEACPGGSMGADCPPGISFDIFVMNADGTNLKNITNDPSADRYPAWSPDGKLAFSSDRTGKGVIYTMNADGSSLTQITEGITYDSEPRWSSDGAWIAYHCRQESETQICVQQLAGDRLMFSFPGTTPVWSPLKQAEPQTLAFLCWSGGHSDICILHPEDSRQVNLTNSAVDEISPAWSPDGRWIAYQSNQGGEISIYLACADCTSAPRSGKVTDGSLNAGHPAWSPDGTRIAFLADSSLYVIGTDGSGQKLLAANVLGTPVWQP